MLHGVYHGIAWWWGGDGQQGPSGTGYLIASGIGAMIPGYATFLAVLWRLRCSEPGCWRIGRHHQKDGGDVCGKHAKTGLPVPVLDRIAEIRELAERSDAVRSRG